MKTKYTKNLEWTEQFVNEVADLVPIDRLKAIKGYRVPPGKEEQCEAKLTRYGNNKTFVLTINIYKQYYEMNGKKTKIFKGYYKEFLAEVLDSLAHELAHLVQFDHVPEHLELQSKIMIRFSKLLKKLNIKNTYARIK